MIIDDIEYDDQWLADNPGMAEALKQLADCQKRSREAEERERTQLIQRGDTLSRKTNNEESK